MALAVLEDVGRDGFRGLFNLNVSMALWLGGDDLHPSCSAWLEMSMAELIPPSHRFVAET